MFRKRERKPVPRWIWWLAIAIAFAFPIGTLLYLYEPWEAGVPHKGSSYYYIIDLLRRGVPVFAIMMFFAVVQELPHLGQTAGPAYKPVRANPKLTFPLWLVHFPLSWWAFGLLTGWIDIWGFMDPIYVERGAGVFLLALGIFGAAWAWGRYALPRQT